MPDIFDKCFRFRQDHWIAGTEDRPVAERVLFDVMPIRNAGPWVEYKGRRVLQFSSNDYLGMSTHPEVVRIAGETASEFGVGAPMGARPLTGTCELHLELERKVAEFKGTQAALTFTMGAGAMMGAIGSLAKPGDILILDQYAHASLVCGGRISGATIRYFRHNDPDSLERVLMRSDPGKARMIVIDGVYSMNGDIAPLPEICDLKEKYGARLFVDDAHGNGVCGENGRGSAEIFGVEERIDIHAGTFSKAFGTSGGFIAADQDVIFYVRNTAPTLLFTKATAACVATATLKSLEIVAKATDRRERAWRNANLLQQMLADRGFDIGETRTPITPIRFAGNDALHVADRLRSEYGIYVSAVVYPAVSKGTTILRVVPTAMHTEENVQYLVESLEKAVVETGVGIAGPGDGGNGIQIHRAARNQE
ncbi:MAG: aminotransferase class I/II-fold pyridoxal phosphate-dependent enzyme [Planctomycetota bacterium]